MKNLSQSMNMKFGNVDNAHVITDTRRDINFYETLCLICAELNIDLKKVTDADFDSASLMLEDFCNAANEETGHEVSVWFD